MRWNRDQTIVGGGVLVIVFSCFALAVQAQDQVPRVAFEHDGNGVTGFVLYAQPQKGKTIRIDLGSVPAREGGVRSALLPSLPDGTYVLSIAAYNPVGESAQVTASPGRIVVKRADTRAAEADRPRQDPPRSSEKVPPPPQSNSEKGATSGPFGKIWRVLVGED